jgi:tetratricopeptide (TPR) repeat protein
MNILSELKEHADNYDLQAMDTLVESLSPVQLEENKQEIIDAYYMVYSYSLYDLDCGKVNDPENFIFFLLEIIGSIQRFFPDQMYYSERGRCYEYLADYTVAYEDKLRYKQQAIQIYTTAPQTTDMQMSMVRVLIDKMEITRQFTTEAFTELLSFFRPVLNDASFVRALIHECFKVRFLPFEQNLYWHQRLLRELEGAMHEHAEKNLLVYLDWAETYQYILYHDSPEIDPGYKATMVTQTALLLKPLEGYYTEDAELLNRLGKAFADTAKRSTDNNLTLDYYQTAIDFFTKGHELQPAAWTFPVYATNALLGMAQIYHEQGAYEKLINAFEHGLQLFSQVYKHEEDFTLNLYWGDFLVAYTGLAYDYKSPSINHRAEEKLQLAIVLGDNYYSRPYFSLARLAIKTGNKEKCVNLLLQCREAIRLRGYQAYDLGEALADEDFREVWDQLH